MKLFSSLTTVALSYEQPRYRDFLDVLNQKKGGWGAPAGRIAALYSLCEPLETPVNGQVVCDQSTCALVCDQGYLAVGRRRTKCRFNPHKFFFWKRLLGECDTCATDLAAPPEGITVTCGINGLNRKKCTYKCANGEKLQLPNGEAYQLTAVCTCPRWNGKNCGWNAKKFSRMITDADVAAFTCPGIATTTASPPVVTTTAAPPVASTTVPPPVASTTAAPTTTAASTSLSCGDLSSFESSFADGTFTCDSSVDSCTATCTDASLFPFPASVVGCNAGEISPTDASSMTFTCKATSCGDPTDFNYGQNWVDVTATCSGETCSLTCDGDASRPVPYPVSEVSCSNGALTPPGGSEIYCAETSCGRLEDFYNVDSTGLTSTCTGDSCSLSCPAGEMPTYLTLQCDTASSTYQHVHDSQSEMVECVPEYDTPCGQIDSAFTIDKSAFNISCSGIESFYQTTPVTCDLTCADPTHTLVGESTIVCENSQFTNAGSEIRCDPPPTKTCVSFQYHDTSMAFADAEVVCANLGGYLPFFKTQEELDLYNSLPSPEIQWLGISKTDNLGGVQAADGSTLTITNWAAGEPNGHNPDFAHLPSQDCIMSKKETDPLAYQWNDVGCVGPIPKFHCRIETEVPVDQADPTDSVCYEPVGTKDCIQFELHDTPVSFADAEQACSSEGSFIAFFKTQEELDAYNTISADTTEWLGISKDGSGGFVAADGSPQTITHWASGEPNGNSFEACIESWSMTAPNGNGKKWNDTTCTLNRKFRCRKEVTIPADQNPADHYCPSV